MPRPSRTARIHFLRTATCAIALLGAASCSSGTAALVLPTASPDVLITPLPAGHDARVDRVVDGDTLVVDGRRVRLIGIDTPETVKPDSPVECYGPQASAATKALLPEGTSVRLVSDAERQDRYGRDLAYVYRSKDGLFVAGYLAQEGFARPLSIKPNVARRTELARLSTQAKSAGRGLWSACK